MDVTRSWGFGGGRKRKARDELAAKAKRDAKAAARKAKRARTAQRQLTCRCDCYPFPHRFGSEQAPSSACSKQVAAARERSGPVFRGRVKRRQKGERQRAALRWGWGAGPTPF